MIGGVIEISLRLSNGRNLRSAPQTCPEECTRSKVCSEHRNRLILRLEARRPDRQQPREPNLTESNFQYFGMYRFIEVILGFGFVGRREAVTRDLVECEEILESECLSA